MRWRTWDNHEHEKCEEAVCSSEVHLPSHRCKILSWSRRTRRSSSPSWTASRWGTSTTSLLMRKWLERGYLREMRADGCNVASSGANYCSGGYCRLAACAWWETQRLNYSEHKEHKAQWFSGTYGAEQKPSVFWTWMFRFAVHEWQAMWWRGFFWL